MIFVHQSAPQARRRCCGSEAENTEDGGLTDVLAARLSLSTNFLLSCLDASLSYVSSGRRRSGDNALSTVVSTRNGSKASKRRFRLHVALARNAAVTSENINALRAASWGGRQPRDWEPVLARSLGWVCARDGERLVGFVNVAWDGGAHAFLLDTSVHPDYQRRGIGTALVREAADLARSAGAVWLHVDYEEDLEAFYRDCGFRPTRAGLIHLAGNSAAVPSHEQ